MFTSPATRLERLSKNFVLTAICVTLAGAAAAWANPEIVSEDPERVPPEGHVRLSLLGTGFRAGATVALCGESIRAVTFVSENQLELEAPPHEVGWCSVVITNPDGTRAESSLMYGRVEKAAVLVTPSPPAPVRPSPPAPSTTPVDFMTRLLRKQDVSSLAHPMLKQPLPAGVIFDWQFSDAWPGADGGEPIVHYEGRLESVNRTGARTWLPFLLDVTREATPRVTAFVVGPDGSTSRDALMTRLEEALGATSSVEWSKPIRPLPVKN